VPLETSTNRKLPAPRNRHPDGSEHTGDLLRVVIGRACGCRSRVPTAGMVALVGAARLVADLAFIRINIEIIQKNQIEEFLKIQRSCLCLLRILLETPHVRREEVEKRRPMSSHKRSPCHRSLPRRRDAVFLQDPSTRGPTHSISDILQGALDPRIAPSRVLGRHAHGQRPDVSPQSSAPTPATGVRPLRCDSRRNSPMQGCE
jgi:hypothetical protein